MEREPQGPGPQSSGQTAGQTGTESERRSERGTGGQYMPGEVSPDQPFPGDRLPDRHLDQAPPPSSLGGQTAR